MSQPYYVTLTGSRNNAGDFLIRHRAHNLLRTLRPDRDLVDMNAWERLTDEQVSTINKSAALILLGGPALRQDMYPKVYPLVEDPDRIKVPITIMGAGWKAFPGYWEDSRNYPYTPQTLSLLQRIDRSGVPISVRDYRTLNALKLSGIDAGVMTGCPALYVPERIGTPFAGFRPAEVKSLVFSLGVNFVDSQSQEEQTKTVIRSLLNDYPQASLTVAFHHSISAEDLKQAYGSRPKFARKHEGMVNWLRENNIAYADISGGVDKLIALYDAADLHVGYRVHAHIFMCSLRKPSVLLTEDGRGRGLKDVLGGLIFDTYARKPTAIVPRALNELGMYELDKYPAFSGVGTDIVNALRYEAEYDAPRMELPATRIDRHYRVMKGYIDRLP